MPVEATPGDAERLSQRLDPDGVLAAGGKARNPCSIHLPRGVRVGAAIVHLYRILRGIDSAAGPCLQFIHT